MTVRILRHSRSDQAVDSELLIETIERNRDRVRTVGNMLLTLSGIMITTSVAVTFFLVQSKSFSKFSVTVLVCATVFFLVSAYLSIFSCFLRTKHVITGREKFISDLLGLLESEVKLIKISFTVLVFGVLTLVIGTVMEVVRSGGKG